MRTGVNDSKPAPSPKASGTRRAMASDNLAVSSASEFNMIIGSIQLKALLNSRDGREVPPSLIPASKSPPSSNVLDYTCVHQFKEHSAGYSDNHVFNADDIEYQLQIMLKGFRPMHRPGFLTPPDLQSCAPVLGYSDRYAERSNCVIAGHINL